MIIEDGKNASMAGTVLSCPLQTGETIRDIKINDALMDGQKREVNELLQEFTSTLTEKPGLTNLIEFSLKLTDDRPI